MSTEDVNLYNSITRLKNKSEKNNGNISFQQSLQVEKEFPETSLTKTNRKNPLTPFHSTSNTMQSDAFQENVNAFQAISAYKPQLNTNQQKFTQDDINVRPTYNVLEQDSSPPIPHRSKYSYVDILNNEYKNIPSFKAKFG